jgi:hypothetical protein
MTDSYYELLDAADPLGEKFCATDLVRSTWTAAIQHAAPVSALLVRALERCAARDDTRLSRVAVDLLGPVPADGDMWVRSKVERPGKQIEPIWRTLRLLWAPCSTRPVRWAVSSSRSWCGAGPGLNHVLLQTILLRRDPDDPAPTSVREAAG